MATSRRRPARSRAWAVAAAVCLSACSSEVAALSISDLTAICEMPIKSINGWTKSALEYLPFNTPRWLERDSASPVDELVVEDHFPPAMPLELEGEDYVRTYPAFPHSPLIVAASTCDSVVLRWKSFDDDLWPVDAFLVERFPSLDVEPQWAVIADGNGTELVDTDVSPAFHYTYRVQVISKNTPSAFSYHWTRIRTSPDGKTCGVLDGHHLAASGLLGALQALTHHHSDAVRTLGLIFACFLTVYGLMRASVNGVQGTRSRSYRLKRIKKSASEGIVKVAAASSPATTRRSSSSSSSTPPSLTMDSSRSNPLDERQSLDHRRSVSLTTRESTAEDPRASLSREPSFRRESRSLGAGRVGERVEYCQDCRKRFGMFRRRHLCDVCHSVTLCRKCGFQAPADSFSSSGGSVGGGRASSASSNAHKVKLRTICRSCCDEVYRYSTAPSVRPSLAAHHSA